MGDRLLTVAEAGKRLSTGPATTYRLIWSKALRAIDISRPGTAHASWRVPESAITEFIRARTREALR